MLKGYLDRVFSAGFAYVIKGEEYLPGFPGKKGVIITACGATTEELKGGGTLRALRNCATSLSRWGRPNDDPLRSRTAA
jgi:putative NADPH-quinone reductase